MTFAVVLISAGAEWRVVRDFYPDVRVQISPFGEFFEYSGAGRPLVFLHGGWGKISAAASAQYAIQRGSPFLLIILGTCGGFDGVIDRGKVILVEQTLVYDIIEQMGDPQAAIQHYTVDLDLSWLREPFPQVVRRGRLVSADCDICPSDIPLLVDQYAAFAADWESGAIAWVARQNDVRCLILRGVSDLVSANGGEAYNAVEVFHHGTRLVIEPMLQALPGWLACMAE